MIDLASVAMCDERTIGNSHRSWLASNIGIDRWPCVRGGCIHITHCDESICAGTEPARCDDADRGPRLFVGKELRTSPHRSFDYGRQANPQAIRSPLELRQD